MQTYFADIKCLIHNNFIFVNVVNVKTHFSNASFNKYTEYNYFQFEAKTKKSFRINNSLKLSK